MATIMRQGVQIYRGTPSAAEAKWPGSIEDFYKCGALYDWDDWFATGLDYEGAIFARRRLGITKYTWLKGYPTINEITE